MPALTPAVSCPAPPGLVSDGVLAPGDLAAVESVAASLRAEGVRADWAVAEARRLYRAGRINGTTLSEEE